MSSLANLEHEIESEYRQLESDRGMLNGGGNVTRIELDEIQENAES